MKEPLAAKFLQKAKAVFALALILHLLPASILPQDLTPAQTIETKSSALSFSKYIDQSLGKTADELVAFALENNGELAAMRKESEAAEALIRQARLRPNPTLETGGTRQIGGSDNSLMIQGALPLELGGRRGARIRVAEREFEIRRLAVAERERLLAAEVRSKFGESLAAAFKLKFTEEILAAATENYNLVAALVAEGRRAPLEQNMETVELNRIRSMREMSEGAVEIKLLELRNLIGMPSEEPLRLNGDFEDLLEIMPSQIDSIQRALQSRPDLQGARAVEQLAVARIEQARAEGKFDADVMLGYQRMKSGFPLSGFDDAGVLQPIDSKFRFFTFGVILKLPIRNRNQGMIAAAVLDEEAARKRREFGELSIRREVAVAYVRYNRASRARQIYKTGVREQSAVNLSVVRQTYELGSKTLLDYIAEQRRFIETENGFIDAQLETYLARVEILRATNATELIRK